MSGVLQIVEDKARWDFFRPGSDYECRDDAGGQRAYECHIAVVEEPMGGFSAHALNLPGAISQGDTILEAIQNAAEACEGVLKEYLSMGHIPWSTVEVDGRIVAERRILVNA